MNADDFWSFRFLEDRPGWQKVAIVALATIGLLMLGQALGTI